MEKCLELQSVRFGNAYKTILLTLILLLVSYSGFSQHLDSLITGNWFEVYKKKKGYYLPLEIALNVDKTARFINRYPESSYNLTYGICTDSSLKLSNGDKYRVLYLDKHLLKLRKNGKIITLKKAGQAE